MTIVVPCPCFLVAKSSFVFVLQAKQLEDETLPRLAHHLGRLCHGLMPNLNADHKVWFINFYKHLSGIGVDGKKAPPPSETGQMPDLVPPLQDKSELFSDCRLVVIPIGFFFFFEKVIYQLHMFGSLHAL